MPRRYTQQEEDVADDALTPQDTVASTPATEFSSAGPCPDTARGRWPWRVYLTAHATTTSRACAAITALYLLRLRLELQRENIDAAAAWLVSAQRVAGRLLMLNVVVARRISRR
jgi:hypothetical protein